MPYIFYGDTGYAQNSFATWGVVVMHMDAVAKSLLRISKELPNLSKDELKLVEGCLEDCFEIGRTWDSVPILVHEAKGPQKIGKRRAR